MPLCGFMVTEPNKSSTSLVSYYSVLEKEIKKRENLILGNPSAVPMALSIPYH